MVLNEEEQKKLERRMAAFGFTEYQSDFFNTRQYKSLRNAFLDNYSDQTENIKKTKLCRMQDVINAGKYIITKHKIDLEIPYSFEDYLISYLHEQFGEEPKEEEISKIIDAIKQNIKYEKVTDIPVFLNINQNKNGYTVKIIPYEGKIESIDYYHQLPPIVSGIGLKGRVDDYSKTTYVHEMYHALSTISKGCIKNRLHDELLSIFMEKVAALELDTSGELLEVRTLSRINSISYDIANKIYQETKNKDPLDNITANTYIISAILATAFFETYASSDISIQKEIDKDVANIFKGEHYLEDVLEKYDITEESGAAIMKKQIQKIKRKTKKLSTR